MDVAKTTFVLLFLPLPVTPAHVTLNLLNSSDVLYVLLPVSAV